MVKLPYGRSNYATLRRDGYYYVDRTGFIAQLEALGEAYLVFLRPRRFGKSLWLSTLSYYYGREHAGDFELLFGGLEAGQTPTPLANQYLVLQFDFSGIDTSTPEMTYDRFISKVQDGIKSFFDRYPEVASEAQQQKVLTENAPETLIMALFRAVADQPQPIYLLIDEYDHFTNELISLDLGHFQQIVTQNGWVRKFYETIKTAAGQGIVDRIFMTGVSPVTLDSLTSGFNISANLSLDPRFHNLMGFLPPEVGDILRAVGADEGQLPAIARDMKRWYDGYRFSIEREFSPIYNPDMVLYFAKEYQHRQAYPGKMLDTNIASDYGKIRRLFQIGGQDAAHFESLRRLLAEGRIVSPLTDQFSFEKPFSQEDFLSLLFYMGMLTIQGDRLGIPVLGIPNTVVEKLFFDYFRDWIGTKIDQIPQALRVQDLVLDMAEHNRPEPLLKLAAETLAQVSNRDFLQFNETGLKMILLSYLYSSQLYYLRSEHEVGQGYVDLLLLRRQPYPAPHQFVFELKYLKKKDADKLEAALAAGRDQLRRYMQREELRHETSLRAWLAVYVGAELAQVEEVSAE